MTKISPFAPTSYPQMPPIAGVKLASIAAQLRYKNRFDLMLAICDEGTAVAGMLTQSSTASSNIHWARKSLPHGSLRALIVNAGNANAFNGKAGEDSVERIVANTSKVLGCQPYEVYPCSTGVIGAPLDDHKITSHLQALMDKASPDGWADAANAIRTTDTYAKYATITTEIDGVPITINGIAKGSGMIAPNMATMLGYFFTDANISPKALQALCAEATQKSFNSITVDGDTSTSDTLLLCATRKATHPAIEEADDLRTANFANALHSVMRDLAHDIVKDGEGAQKFVTINVSGAKNDRAAHVIAMSIANSPLVKTAIAGEDANWGRIVMAVGKTSEVVDRQLLSVAVGGVVLARDGMLNDSADISAVDAHMKEREILIEVDLNLTQDSGSQTGSATVWTCDLTDEYIHINADYRS